MRALLVRAECPPTYWGYQFSLPFIRKKATIPPLGLATLAALLPRHWELRIHDLQVAPLPDDVLRWADAVLVSGMLVEEPSMHEVLRRARALGRRTVAGGPAPTTAPERFADADHVFLGEAEGRLDLLVEALERPEHPAPRVLSPCGEERPDMALSPVPRFDLVDLDAYATMAIQWSRGCPFTCEFCDIIEIFGRVPRVKSAEQVTAELEELHRLGARGPLFIVDDNFIGNRRAAAKLLPRVAEWQRSHGRPFDLYTEASVDLAGEKALVASLVDAGFTAVFLGLETPSAESLAGAGKRQNLKLDLGEAVLRLTRAGLEVFAGFIIGFDEDREDIFERQRAFIESIPVPRAMLGLLSALPGTALWRRLEKEGRLRGGICGDQFGRPNFEPAMDEVTLLRGYRRLLGDIYSADAYYARCARHLDEAGLPPTTLRPGWAPALARAVWRIGIRGERRRHFWRLLLHSLRRGRRAFPQAVTLAVLGEHLVRYTDEVVIPRLDGALAEMGEPVEARPAPRPTAVAPALPWGILPGDTVAS